MKLALAILLSLGQVQENLLECEAGWLTLTESKVGVALAYQVYFDNLILTCTPKK